MWSWTIRWRGMSGSSDPERVAITSPSSGLKPMLVSRETPCSTAVADAPPPRWQTTRRRSVAGRPRSAAPRSVGPLHRQPVEPVAAHAPRLRDRVDGRLLGEGGVEGRVEDGDLRHAGRRRGPRRCRRRAGALWSGATALSRARSCTRRSSISTARRSATRRRRPGGPRPRGRPRPRRGPRAPSSARAHRPCQLHPGRAGVDRQHRSAPEGHGRSVGHDPAGRIGVDPPWRCGPAATGREPVTDGGRDGVAEDPAMGDDPLRLRPRIVVAGAAWPASRRA